MRHRKITRVDYYVDPIDEKKVDIYRRWIAWIMRGDVTRFRVSLFERRLFAWSFARYTFAHAKYLSDFPQHLFSISFYFGFRLSFFFFFFFLRAGSRVPRRARDPISSATISQHRSEMRFKLRQIIRRYIYIYVQARLLYPAARLLVKIHLITEHYRAEGVMIAALARNRNRSVRREREELGANGSRVGNCLYLRRLIFTSLSKFFRPRAIRKSLRRDVPAQLRPRHTKKKK